MKLAIIGTGYVGLVAGVCFAHVGNQVLCVDVDEAKLSRLQSGEPTIYEPGLDHLLARNLRENRLRFTSDLGEAVRHADIIFLALPTPPGRSGEADLSFVLDTARQIGALMEEYRLVVTKSTVPVGTGDKVREEIEKSLHARGADIAFDVASNPEFLREGMAVQDFLQPDRVVIGVNSDRAEKLLRELHHPFLLTDNPLLVMDVRSAEITKYAANAMLAARVSFMNDIANLCDACGANVDWVRLGIGLDPRIGKQFLQPGAGFGGSCLPKDVSALIEIGKQFGASQRVAEATLQVNESQKRVLLPRLEAHFGGDLQNKTIALWGVAFKPDTDDIREAPALTIIEELLARGAKIRAYDPEAMPPAQRVLAAQADKIHWAKSPYEACENADALIIATEWGAFREPDFEKLQQLLKEPLILDGRNIYELETMREHGFTYYSIGRPTVHQK